MWCARRVYLSATTRSMASADALHLNISQFDFSTSGCVDAHRKTCPAQCTSNLWWLDICCCCIVVGTITVSSTYYCCSLQLPLFYPFTESSFDSFVIGAVCTCVCLCRQPTSVRAASQSITRRPKKTHFRWLREECIISEQRCVIHSVAYVQ